MNDAIDPFMTKYKIILIDRNHCLLLLHTHTHTLPIIGRGREKPQVMRLFFDILLYLIFNLDLHNIRIGGVNVWLQQ
jgi:hypothetical protein